MIEQNLKTSNRTLILPKPGKYLVSDYFFINECLILDKKNRQIDHFSPNEMKKLIDVIDTIECLRDCNIDLETILGRADIKFLVLERIIGKTTIDLKRIVRRSTGIGYDCILFLFEDERRRPHLCFFDLDDWHHYFKK